MLGGLTASEWEASDDEAWDSESFESTLSSIAGFDLEGALERMASGDKFYTPEPADSTHRGSPAGDYSGSHERLQPSHDSSSMLEDVQLGLSEPGHQYAEVIELNSSAVQSFSHDLLQMTKEVHCWGSLVESDLPWSCLLHCLHAPPLHRGLRLTLPGLQAQSLG